MRALNERRPFVKRRSHTFVRLRVVSRTTALHCSPAKSRMSANGPLVAVNLMKFAVSLQGPLGRQTKGRVPSSSSAAMSQVANSAAYPSAIVIDSVREGRGREGPWLAYFGRRVTL